MIIKNFAALEEQSKKMKKKRLAVVNAVDQASLEAVFHPNLKEAFFPVLVGDEKEIIEKLIDLNLDENEHEILHAESKQEAAYKAVELVRNNEVQVLMKADIGTADFLKPVVAKETGIKGEGLLSHIALKELPTYPKFLLSTDGGMVISPSLDDKMSIINNAVSLMRKLGYEQPKVAVLAAAEGVNKKIQSSVEAEQLKKMNEEGIIKNCIVEGPISLDLAVNKQIALVKGYSSPVAGDADILLSPDLTTANVLGKSMILFAGGRMAGLICGAKVPIVLCSRGSSSEEKYLSILLAAFL